MHRTQSPITLGAGLLASVARFVWRRSPITAPTPPPDASSADDATALAKKLQNPIGDLYSFPFQNNTNFNAGPHKGTQDILNVQPVIPIHINEDWNVITRTILPLVWQPSFQPAQTVPFGTGPTTFSAFLSPTNPTNGWLWGVGPVVRVADDQQQDLGSNVWGGGPTGVLVYMNGPGSPACWPTTCGRSAAPRARRHTLQHVPDAAVRELQFRRGMVRRHRPHHHGELAHGRQQCLDAAGRRRGRPCREDRRQAAGEFPDRRLLQRAASAIRLDLAASHAGHPHLLGTYRKRRFDRHRLEKMGRERRRSCFAGTSRPDGRLRTAALWDWRDNEIFRTGIGLAVGGLHVIGETWAAKRRRSHT